MFPWIHTKQKKKLQTNICNRNVHKMIVFVWSYLSLLHLSHECIIFRWRFNGSSFSLFSFHLLYFLFLLSSAINDSTCFKPLKLVCSKIHLNCFSLYISICKRNVLEYSWSGIYYNYFVHCQFELWALLVTFPPWRLSRII